MQAHTSLSFILHTVDRGISVMYNYVVDEYISRLDTTTQTQADLSHQNCTNGVDMVSARFDADKDAFLMETIAMLNNWTHYYD